MVSDKDESKINRIAKELALSSISSIDNIDQILSSKDSCIKNPLLFTAVSSLITQDTSPARSYAIELYLESRKGTPSIIKFYDRHLKEDSSQLDVLNNNRIILKTTFESPKQTENIDLSLKDNKLLDQINSLMKSYDPSSSNDLIYKDYVDLTTYINTHHFLTLNEKGDGSLLNKYDKSILTRMELCRYIDKNNLNISELLILKPELTGIERELRLFKISGLFLLCDLATGKSFKLDSRQNNYTLEEITNSNLVTIEGRNYLPVFKNEVLELQEEQTDSNVEDIEIIAMSQPEIVVISLDESQFTDINTFERFKLVENKLQDKTIEVDEENNGRFLIDMPFDFNKDEKALLLGKLSIWYDRIQKLNNTLVGTYDTWFDSNLNNNSSDIVKCLIKIGYKGKDNQLELLDFLSTPQKLELGELEYYLVKNYSWPDSKKGGLKKNTTESKVKICAFIYQLVRALEVKIGGGGAILNLAESLENINSNIKINNTKGKTAIEFIGEQDLSELDEEQKTFISGRLSMTLFEEAQKVNPEINPINQFSIKYNFENDGHKFMKAIIQIVSVKGSLSINFFDLLEEVEKINYGNLLKDLIKSGWKDAEASKVDNKKNVGLMLCSFANAIETKLYGEPAKIGKKVSKVSEKKVTSDERVLKVGAGDINIKINLSDKTIKVEDIEIKDGSKTIALLQLKYIQNEINSDEDLILITLKDALNNSEQEIYLNINEGEQIRIVNDSLPFEIDLKVNSLSQKDTTSFANITISAISKI